MSREKVQQAKGAIEIMEEAVHLLRLAPAGILASYYIGTLPFILGLLYFWADMSRNAFAIEYCAVTSLGLALLFVWMKCWHAIFAQKIGAQISREPGPRWSLGRIANLTATQSIIQASGIVVLPLSLLVAFPFGWSYAFYQNVSAQDDGENNDLKTILKRSWKQAQLWPGQNHILLLVFSLFGLFVFLNLALSIFLFPHMLKKIFGIETMFTMSGLRVLNTTFLAAALSLTYLCTDPLVKTVYALRCFYGSSLRSGEDIKTELKSFAVNRKMAVAIFIFFLGSTPFYPLWAGEHAKMPHFESRFQNGFISPEALDRSIKEVINRPEFAWRMPREKLPKEDPSQAGLIEQFIEWTTKTFEKIGKTIARWMDTIIDWVENFFPKADRGKETSTTDWLGSARSLLFVLLAVLTCLLAIFFWRTWQRRKERHVSIVRASIPSTPDLKDDQINADELPVNRWLTMARELMEKGSLRLALRAFFLATLAHLAKQEMITIAKYKSNRDYEQELHRRAHHKQGIPALFSKNVAVFDRSWYGKYEVTLEDMKRFILNQERIMAFVEE